MENKFMDEKMCCGCGACKQICPKNCIKLVENKRGFLVPQIDYEKCINCGACKNVCPELKNEIEFKEVKKAYAAILNNTMQLKKSTSGGIFYYLARLVLQMNGIVFGVAWDSIDKLQHIKVQCVEDLNKVMQSKYIQSDIKNTFREAQKELKENKLVLFSGTACQIAGLNAFLNCEYENLITIEVACHGVPSIGLFRKYINWRGKTNKSKVIECVFRNRDKH